MDSVASFAPKITDHDCDIRFMAVSDLNTFLDDCAKGSKKLSSFMRSSSDQKTVFDCLLRLVRAEKEGTVQEQVQKCFYYLCRCADIERAKCTDAIQQLLKMIKDEAKSTDEGASNRREVASLALREALKGINEVPQSKGTAATFAPALFEIVKDTAAAGDTRVKACECFTVIIQSDNQYVAANAGLTNDLFQLLTASTANSLSLFRKRLVTCIVALSSELSDEAFAAFVNVLCKKLHEISVAQETPFAIASSIVQIIGAVTATPNGARITNSLDAFIPLFVVLCKEPTNASMEDSDEIEDDSNAEALDELRSLIFQACEILLGKCSPASLIPLLKPLLQLISKFISYNPNFFEDAEDDDDDEAKMSDAPAAAAAAGGDDDMGDDDNDGFDDDFASDFDDDDVSDSSWKIRRDVIRCFVAISAVLVQSPVQFVESVKAIFDLLFKRLNDRDESVLLEALTAISTIVRNCSRVATTFNAVKTKSIVQTLSDLFSTTLVFAAKIARKLAKILNDEKTTVKVRTSCIQLAAALVRFDEEICKKGLDDAGKANQAKFAESVATIWSSVNKTLSTAEKSSDSTVSSGIPSDPAAASLNIESLHLLQAFIGASSVGVSSRKHAIESAATVAKCVADPYVHAASEALRVIPVIMAALKNEDGKVGTEDANVVDTIANAVVTKFGVLGNSGLDYEVKECAVSAIVSIIAIGGNVVPAANLKDKCLPIVMNAMQNESTRIIGIKALNDIAVSPLPLDISSISGPAIDFLSKVVKEDNKQMRQSGLTAAASVLKHETGGKSVSEAQIVALLKEIYYLISGEDLYLSHLVINVAANAIACSNTSSVKKTFAELFVGPINKFISGQPVQGATLSSLVLCFNVCGKNGVFSSPMDVVESFIKLISGAEITKQIVASVATICAAYINGISDKKAAVKKFISLCKKPFAEENQMIQSFSMLTIGHVGRDNDLADFLKEIMNDIAELAFQQGSDEIRSSAAFMLGSVAAGSISTYIQAIDAWAKKAQDSVQYYVLATLREFSSRLMETDNVAGSAQVCAKVAEMVKSLISKEDEGKRNIASECLGRLCTLTPATVCPVILAMAKDASKECRTIAAGTIRVVYSNVIGSKSWQCENRAVITRFIRDNARALFGLITDAEVQVRHVLLLTLNYVLHQNSFELIPEDVFNEIAPSVLRETEVRPELIEIVEYGPHKVRQDHGKDARKAAYECLSTLLDAYPDVLKLEDVVKHVGTGITDEYDVNLLAIQIGCKLASSSLSANALLPFVDSTLKAPIDSTVFPKSTNKKKEDEEEHKEDAKKKVMRLIALLKNVPGIAAAAPEFIKFVNTRILSTPTLSALLKDAEESLKSSK